MQYIHINLFSSERSHPCPFEMSPFSSMLGLVSTVNVFVSSVDVLGAAELASSLFLTCLNTPPKTFALSMKYAMKLFEPLLYCSMLKGSVVCSCEVTWQI